MKAADFKKLKELISRYDEHENEASMHECEMYTVGKEIEDLVAQASLTERQTNELDDEGVDIRHYIL